MEYTREQMWRDLIPPCVLTASFVIGWIAITWFESVARGKPFLDCLLICT